ncbi:MAG: hypothetical protein ABR545_08975 [Cyclonatronaceae bacterium]
MRFIITLCIFYLSACTAVFSQQVYTFSDKDTLRVGELFEYSIVIDNPGASRTAASPDTSFFSSVFELRDVRVFKPAPNRDSLAITIQFFGTADTSLSYMPIRYSADSDSALLRTGTFPIVYRPTAEDADESEFRPLKPIFEFALNWWPWIILALLVLVAGFLLYRYLKNRPKPVGKPVPTPVKIPPFVNPIENLENRLISIKSDSELYNRDPKGFYMSLGDALRAYFEELYTIPALESTTRDLGRELVAQMVDSHLTQIVIGILREADMVKFAKYIPWPDEAEKSLAAGFLFLERAKTMDRHKVVKMQHDYNRKYFPEDNKTEPNNPHTSQENIQV